MLHVWGESKLIISLNINRSNISEIPITTNILNNQLSVSNCFTTFLYMYE